MTINYYLDRPRSTGETAIYLFLRIGKQTIKLKTGQYINPNFWSPKADKSGHHVNRKYTGCVEFNAWLDTLKGNVHKRYNELTTDGQSVSLQDLRDAVLAIIERRAPQESAGGFLEHFQAYIDAKATERAAGTISSNKITLSHLKEFSRVTGYKLTFESINLTFFDKFRNYLVRDKEGTKHTDNTLWKSFATVKAFMSWALDRDLHASLTFKKFKVSQKDADTVSLTEKELMTLYEADLPLGSKLDRVRDVFCFGCFTGQRYSDIANLKRSDIKGDRWHLRTLKTDKSNQVPLNGFALAILDKYQEMEKPLPVMSNQKTNDYLKDLCELLEIKDPVTQTRRRGSERLANTQPKYKFIASHTARRTFITLSLEKGMRPEVVMRISGHSNYATFKKYIRLSDKVTENEMNEVWKMSTAPVEAKKILPLSVDENGNLKRG
jgi:integrase